jgi:cation:H+ antiporter
LGEDRHHPQPATAVGILFTPWDLDGLSLLCAVLALLSAGFIYARLQRKEHIKDWHLLVGRIFHMVFVAAVFASSQSTARFRQ